MDRRLVDHFVNADLVSRASMQRFILRATRNKTGVLQEILKSETLDEQAIADGLSSCYGHDRLGNEAFEVAPAAIAMLSGKMAKENGVLPVAVSDSGNKITIAVYDTEGTTDVLDTLRTATGNQPKILVAAQSFLEDAIDHYYFDEEWALKNEYLANSADGDSRPEISEEDSVEILLDEIVEEEEFEAGDAAQERSNSRITPPPLDSAPASPSPANTRPRKRQDSVEKALEDFDSFLDEGDYASGAPGIGSIDEVANESQWGSDDHMNAQSGFSGSGAFELDQSDQDFDDEAFASAFHATSGNSRNKSGFDLFEPSEPGSTVETIAKLNEERIQKLKQELKRQREVVSALVDLLIDARVLSRKELMQLVKKKRR